MEALDIIDREAVVHKICTYLRRGREPCLRCPEWKDSHRGRSHSSIGVQHWIPTGLDRRTIIEAAEIGDFWGWGEAPHNDSFRASLS